MEKSKAVIVCGLGFGDEGKGTITDALARRFGASTNVRYNGGPQAGHNVVTPDGIWHCFAQFGSASFVSGVRTILSRHMLVNLDNMDVEAEVLEGKGLGSMWERLTVDPGCSLITPMQKIVGRMREIRRNNGRNGSCGQGVGETVLDRESGLGVSVGDILDGAAGKKKIWRLARAKLCEAAEVLSGDPPNERLLSLNAKLIRIDPEALYCRYRFALEASIFSVEDSARSLARAFASSGPVIFEGAQGALLDRTRGYVPYVTKSDTTCRNALDLVGSASARIKPYKLGILRAYGHRHGPGPFPAEDGSLQERFDDPRNQENEWQGKFRVGWLDLCSLDRGIAVNDGVHGLALTCLDRLSGLEDLRVRVSPSLASEWRVLPGWHEEIGDVRRFEGLPKNAQRYVRFIERSLRVPIDIVSVGPRSDQKLFLR